MGNMKLLIIDDEMSKVNQIQTVLGEEFDYINLQTLSEFETYINTNDDYHAVFLDLRFDNENITLDLEKIKEIKLKLNPYSKLIIYTAFTVNHIELIKDMSKLGIIDEWVDIGELKFKDKMESAKLRILNCLSYSEDLKNGLWIIHLSDLHNGRQWKFGDEEIRDSLVDLIINQIKSNISDKAACRIGKPSTIITSGDLTHSSEIKDFEAYKNFHLKLINSLKKLDVKYPISVIVPGNHDFSWRISIIEENTIIENDGKLTIKEEHTESDYYKSLKWMPFIDNVTPIENATIKSDDNYSWWIHDYSKRLGINLYGINSAKDFTYKSKNKISLNRRIIQELENKTKLIDSQLGILVIHHPVALWGDDNFRSEILRYLYTQLNIRIIFSGHKHRGNINKHKIDSDLYILEIQTGSAGSNEGGLDTFQIPNYRIINIKKNMTSGKWDSIESFTFSYQDGAFIIQPKSQSGSLSEIENISNY